MASIAEILMAQGRAAGDQRRQRANVWMPTIQHLANLPNQVMNDRAMERAAQEAAFDRGQQRDVRGQQLAAGDAALAEKEASAEQKAHMNEVLSTEGVIGPDNVFNADKAREIARSKRYQDIAGDIENVAREWNEAHAKQLQSSATLAKTEGDTRHAETGERSAANQQGVRRMIGELIANRGSQPFSAGDAQTVQGMALQEGIDLPKGILPEPEEEVSMVVRGPNGRPMRVLVPKSQFRQGRGVEEYREPSSAGGSRDTEWVMRNGVAKQIPKGTASEGDTPYSAPKSTSETAQDRQRKGRLESARGFLTRLNELRDTINTKIGPQAGLTGSARQVKAALGWDPDVAEYERVRAAGGRALAVAIMGAQNLSDADAQAWANMLPGARIDKVTAKRLTDQIGKMLEDTDDAPKNGPIRLETDPAKIAVPKTIGRFQVVVGP